MVQQPQPQLVPAGENLHPVFAEAGNFRPEDAAYFQDIFGHIQEDNHLNRRFLRERTQRHVLLCIWLNDLRLGKSPR